MGGRVYLKGKPDRSAAGVRDGEAGRGGGDACPLRRCVGTGKGVVVRDGRPHGSGWRAVGGRHVETACSGRLGMC